MTYSRLRFAWIEEPPFNYLEDGAATGCDVELARYVSNRLGLRFEPIRTEFAELLSGLADNRWDMATGMFVTPERAIASAFTRPIWQLRDGLLIQEQASSWVTGYRSLAQTELKLAVLKGQVQADAARRNGISDEQLVSFRDYGEAADAVRSGVVAAYASVDAAHRAFLDRSKWVDFRCITVPDTEPSDLGAFACATAETRDRVDAVLAPYLGTADHSAMLLRFGLVK